MTILNQTNDGLPNVLVVLYDAVARHAKAIDRDDLLEMVAPKGVAHEGGKQARQTLNRWIELGLFTTQDNVIDLARRPATPPGTDIELLSAVRRSARERVLEANNNADLWATEGARAADFTRSMAWVLAQDVYRTHLSDLEAFEARQLQDGTPVLMQNDTRRRGLKAWGQFLGFLRPANRGEIEIDPTVAVRDLLPDLMQEGTQIPAASLVEQLAHKLPILDGGLWRRQVLERCKPDAFPAMAGGQLSTSLSRALLNLMRNEEIILENRADTRSGIVLTGQAGIRTDLRFTWVRRTGAGGSP